MGFLPITVYMSFTSPQNLWHATEFQSSLRLKPRQVGMGCPKETSSQRGLPSTASLDFLPSHPGNTQPLPSVSPSNSHSAEVSEKQIQHKSVFVSLLCLRVLSHLLLPKSKLDSPACPRPCEAPNILFLPWPAENQALLSLPWFP